MLQQAETPRPALSAFSLIVDGSEEDSHRVGRMSFSALRTPPKLVGTMVEALDLVSQYQFSLVMIDNALPDGLGIQLAEMLRRMPAYAGTPLLLFDDWRSPFLGEKAKAAKVNALMNKADLHPSHITELLRYGRIRAASIRPQPRQSRELSDRAQLPDPAFLPPATSGARAH